MQLKEDIENKINYTLTEEKQKLKDQINSFNIQSKEITDEINSEIEDKFSIDDKNLKKIIEHQKNRFSFDIEKINKDNFNFILDEISEKEIIDKKEKESFIEIFKKSSSSDAIIKLRNYIKTYITSESINNYLYWFDLIRRKYLKDFIEKMKLIESMTKGIKSFQNLFGRFWCLSLHDLSKMDMDFIKKFSELFKQKNFINKIAELLGRLFSSEKKYEEFLIEEKIIVPNNKKTFYSPGNITSVIFGNDIHNLLKHQLSLKNRDKAKWLFKANYLEKKLLQLDQKQKYLKSKPIWKTDHKPKEEKAGPFILCIDTSGSMHGEPETIAKAMSLAIIKVANKDNRKCFIINFSTEIIEFDASNLSKNFNKLYEFLSMSFHGGTDINPSMEAAIKKVKEKDYHNADILFISDFIINSLEDSLKRDILLLKEKKVRFHALSIGYSQILEHMDLFDSNMIYDGTNESIYKIIEQLNKLG